MPAKRTALPRLLLEDYLSILRGLVLLAWAGAIGAIMTELSMRFTDMFVWPETGAFSLMYNALLAVFLLNTLALTALLIYPDWYERVPRASAHRVQWLLVAVMVWLGLYVLAVFHVTGALSSPFLLLLPVLMIAALAALPGQAGWWAAALLLAGHVAVLVFESAAVINPRGPLGAHFAYAPYLTPWGLGALLFVLAISVLLAARLRAWLYPAEPSLSPAQRIDPDTGLYRRAFLDSRLQKELGRIRRQGGSAALLLIAMDAQETAGEKRVRDAAQALRGLVRAGSDTPVVYRQGVLAVLLPAADTEGANSAARRIVKGLSNAGTHGALRTAAAVAEFGAMPLDKWLATAEDVLKRAVPGDDPLIVDV